MRLGMGAQAHLSPQRRPERWQPQRDPRRESPRSVPLTDQRLEQLDVRIGVVQAGDIDEPIVTAPLRSL